MKKLFYILAIFTASTCISVYTADKTPNRIKLDKDDWRNELPEEALKADVKNEQEVKEALNKLVAQKKSELVNDPDTDKLIEEIAKKQLSADAQALYSEEKAKQQGKFIAMRNAASNEYSHSPEQAEIDGKYQALVAQAVRRNGPGFFQKTWRSLQDVGVNVCAALAQQVALSIGASVIAKASKAYTSSNLSPEERIKAEQEEKWENEARELQKEIKHTATYIHLVTLMNDVKTLKKDMPDIQKQHQELLQEKAIEEEKRKASLAKEREEKIKAVTALANAKEESKFKTFKNVHGKDALQKQDVSTQVFRALHENVQAGTQRTTLANQKTKQETLINMFKALHNDEGDSIPATTSSTQSKSAAPAA